MSIGRKTGTVIATGLGVVLALASLNLFAPQASATIECPTGVENGPPCGPSEDSRIDLKCPDGHVSPNPPCGPPDNLGRK
jgi:hypothetical protein